MTMRCAECVVEAFSAFARQTFFLRVGRYLSCSIYKGTGKVVYDFFNCAHTPVCRMGSWCKKKDCSPLKKKLPPGFQLELLYLFYCSIAGGNLINFLLFLLSGGVIFFFRFLCTSIFVHLYNTRNVRKLVEKKSLKRIIIYNKDAYYIIATGMKVACERLLLWYYTCLHYTRHLTRQSDELFVVSIS